MGKLLRLFIESTGKDDQPCLEKWVEAQGGENSQGHGPHNSLVVICSGTSFLRTSATTTAGILTVLLQLLQILYFLFLFFNFCFFGQRAQSGGQHACPRQACVALQALIPEEEARLFPRRIDSQQTTAEITLILHSQESRRKNHRLGVERKDRKVSEAQRPPSK